jgi:hypothetical protein
MVPGSDGTGGPAFSPPRSHHVDHRNSLTLIRATGWIGIGNIDAKFGLRDALISFINENC